ncbi:hypothetical protein L218DRAFT_859355 [Marasmius fiardii PR-910]|nr:hypothetical protein L218DRAFT_859355 [Marasmius fiardii PR-910]
MISNNTKSNLSLDVPDPVDFPEPSKAPGLRSLDSALRCPICGELFDGPVTLLCGHCFCSLCIRQTLNEKQACPTCRKSDLNEGHLRVNTAMEEAVSAWKLTRPFVLDLIANIEAAATEPPSKKRKLSPNNAELEPLSSFDQSDIPQSVSCPSCGKSVKLAEINAHLDRSCEDPPARPSSETSKTQWQNILGPKSQVSNKVKGKGKDRQSREPEDDEPLPKKSYGVLKDKVIRALLQESDLPAHGDRNTLIVRHQQWVIMYNANLDKSERLRKPVEALKRDLRQWEAQQKGKSKPDIGDPGGYERQNRNEFAKLIAAARPKKPDTIISSDVGDVAGDPPASTSHRDIIVVDGD